MESYTYRTLHVSKSIQLQGLSDFIYQASFVSNLVLSRVSKDRRQNFRVTYVVRRLVDGLMSPCFVSGSTALLSVTTAALVDPELTRYRCSMMLHDGETALTILMLFCVGTNLFEFIS